MTPPMTTAPEGDRARAERLRLYGLLAHWRDASQAGWARRSSTGKTRSGQGAVRSGV